MKPKKTLLPGKKQGAQKGVDAPVSPPRYTPDAIRAAMDALQSRIGLIAECMSDVPESVEYMRALQVAVWAMGQAASRMEKGGGQG